MATDKPRLSISMSEETFEKVIAYKEEKGFATQSKAIIKLMEMGLSELEREIAQKALSLSDRAQKVAKQYSELDLHGQEAVDAVLEVEYKRYLDHQTQPKQQKSPTPVSGDGQDNLLEIALIDFQALNPDQKQQFLDLMRGETDEEKP